MQSKKQNIKSGLKTQKVTCSSKLKDQDVKYKRENEFFCGKKDLWRFLNRGHEERKIFWEIMMRKNNKQKKEAPKKCSTHGE